MKRVLSLFLVFLIVLLALTVSSVKASPDGWVSPSGFEDPANMWTNEPNAYDENTATLTENSFPVAGWHEPIILTLSAPITSDKIRFYALYDGIIYQNQIRVEVFKDGDWVLVYEGVYTDKVWVEKSFVEGSVSKARIHIYSEVFLGLCGRNLYEFDFWGEAPPSYGEDFLTYTEVDTVNDRIQRVGDPSHHIDFVSSRNAEETYVYKDFGVDHFGDFEHKVDAKMVSGTWLGHIWGLSNTVDELLDCPLWVSVAFRYGATSKFIYLYEYYDSTTYSDTCALTLGTTYYLLIKKTGTTLLCGVYSTSELRDAGDATDGDIDNLALTLHADHKFRYVYGCSSHTLTSAELGTFDIDNLDLQEGAPPSAVLRRLLVGVGL